MSLRLPSCAVLCQLVAIHVIAITLAGCGGATTTSRSDAGGPPDASRPADAATSCPGILDINSGAALGKACATEATYCTDPACDPCVQNCPAVSCTNGTWKPAVNTALCTADAVPPPCPAIDGSGFDQSCQSDPDCVAVTAGSFCPGAPQCLCGRDAINAKDKSSYEQQLSAIEAQSHPGPGGCNCPFFGTPRCIAHHCTLCGGAGPACPDGG